MKHTSILSIAAVVAASAFALHAPVASAADNAASTQKGVPGVDLDVGKNASDKGVPGVEMNIGKDGDQKNVDIGKKDKAGKDTHTLGAGADKTVDTKDSKAPAKRADKN